MLMSEGQLRGHLAMWVARQHPFRTVAGVDDVGDLITAATEGDDWIGPDDCRMRHFGDWRELEQWLRGIVGEHPQLTIWNTPRCGGAETVFVSRHESPPAERDFIDIDALFRNIALHAWRESEAEDASNARIDGLVATSQ